MSILKNFNNIFLDRDGIINEVIMRDSVVSSPRSIDEFKFRSEIKEFVTALQKQNKKIFVVSNQPDIARKKLTEENLELMTDLIRNELKINQISYCKHDNSDNCKCRKPLPGMLNHYLEIYNLSKSQSVMIGDSIKDIEAAKGAGIRAFLLETNYNKDVKKSVECTHISNLRELL